MTAAATEAYLDDIWNRITKSGSEGFIELPEKDFVLPADVYRSDLLDLLDSPSSSTAMVDKEKHAFWFDVAVPDELDQIVIFDASANKRLLEKLDTSIDAFLMRVAKDYSALTIHYCRTNVGRNTVTHAINGGLLRKEVAHLLRTHIPAGESCVLFHLAEGERREKAESPVSQLLQVELGDANSQAARESVVPVSWGKAKGVNSLKQHRYGTHLGIPYLEKNQLRAMAAGQKRDESYRVSTTDVVKSSYRNTLISRTRESLDLHAVTPRTEYAYQRTSGCSTRMRRFWIT